MLVTSLAISACYQIPNPLYEETIGVGTQGASDSLIDCTTLPFAAVGAAYDFEVPVEGGREEYGDWEATNLPPGLSIDVQLGVISGTPEEATTHAEITVSMVGPAQRHEASCGPLVVRPRLSALGLTSQAQHCVPHDTTSAELLALLEGGDNTPLRCQPLEPKLSSPSCPLGDGNGRAPPGISLDSDSCTHTGTFVEGQARGTWVWVVEVEQSGYTTHVPFCATNELDTFHDILVTMDATPQSDLQPGLFEYDPSQSLSFGGSTHAWDIQDPQCAGSDPAPCNTFGFKYAVSCSPFDPPFMLIGQSSDTGLTHELTATGPIPAENFGERPWVASFELSYCTSDTLAECDLDGAFEQNAQTRYHFDVIGYPSL